MVFNGFDVLSFFSLTNIFAIFLGTVVGMLLGALPGLGIMITIVLLFPITFMFPPLAAILLLLSAYQSSEYGGSISSIILGIPGTTAAVPTLLDGRPLAKNVSPGKAISYSLVSSTIGGIIGALVLIFLAIPLSSLALKISDPEYFLISVLGLLGVAMLSTKDKIISAISVILGLMVGTIGMDLFTGKLRFTLGYLELMEGVSLIALVVGIFAIPEIFEMISNKSDKKQHKREPLTLKGGLTIGEFKMIVKATGIGSMVGAVIGIFPGVGSGTASWFSYSLAKKISKHPETFGKGNPEGIAAPESANNAVVGGALLPLLTLGIPGSAAVAVIMGAFLVHGITPGPEVFLSDTNLAYGILFGLLLTTIAMYITGRLLTPVFARVLTIPVIFLIPTVLLLSILGVYIASNQFFNIWVALIVGIIFFLLKELDYSRPSFILGFILCPIIEVSLRRTLVLFKGDFRVFVERPFSFFILLIILALLSISFLPWLKKKIFNFRHKNSQKHL